MSFLKSAKTYYVLLMQLTMGLLNYAKDHQSIDLSEGVVIDKANNTAFVSHPTKGIDSISLDSGSVIWHSDDAEKPLLLRNSELISQAHSLTLGELLLVSLDKSTGVHIAKNNYVLPGNIIANVSQGLEHKFNIKDNYESNSKGNLHWNHSYKLAQGIAQMPTVNTSKKSSNKKTYGYIVFDQSKASNGFSKLIDTQLIIVSDKPKQLKFPIEGKFIDQQDGRQFTSVSKHNILVSQINEATSLTNKYKWDIYTFDNRLLGTIMHSNSYRPFEVVGDIILITSLPQNSYDGGKITESPMMLNAYSLSTGENKWTHAIKNHRYTGPYPP